MAESETSKSAKILYRPVGLIRSTVGGLLAGIVFNRSGGGPPPMSSHTRLKRWRSNTHSKRSCSPRPLRASSTRSLKP